MIAAFLLFDDTGALDYGGVFERPRRASSSTNDGQLVAACLLLLVGAFAKSAQIPLHTWLPDAMEGPTPVSALIHAATMVTAGVYLIARMFPLFELAPTAADVGAIIGTADAVRRRDDRARRHRPQARHRLLDDVADRLHGPRRLGVRLRRRAVPPDDARVLQGAALHGRRLGDRARWAATQSLDKMGGFRKAMPFTFVDVHDRRARAGRRSRSFAGFFSKDEILAFTLNRGGLAIVVLGVIALRRRADDRVLRVPDGLPRVLRRPGRRRRASSSAATSPTTTPRNPLTGEPEDTDVGFPGAEHHIAEREWPMKVAMAPLALLRGRRRHGRHPGRDRHARALPRADLRGLALPRRPPERRRRVRSASAIGGVIALARHRGSRTCVYMRRRGLTARLRDRFRAAARLPRAQVVLRRAVRRRRSSGRSPRSAASAAR